MYSLSVSSSLTDSKPGDANVGERDRSFSTPASSAFPLSSPYCGIGALSSQCGIGGLWFRFWLKVCIVALVRSYDLKHNFTSIAKRFWKKFREAMDVNPAHNQMQPKAVMWDVGFVPQGYSRVCANARRIVSWVSALSIVNPAREHNPPARSLATGCREIGAAWAVAHEAAQCRIELLGAWITVSPI